jgi:hypothetical protein
MAKKSWRRPVCKWVSGSGSPSRSLTNRATRAGSIVAPTSSAGSTIARASSVARIIGTSTRFAAISALSAG